jgi:trimethylamine:corrinoid methyltransferase-like protein
MFGAVAGAPWFGGAGVLSLDEMFSDEQLVLTLEVRDYVDRMRRGFEFSPRALGLEEIMDAVPRGEGYLSRDETVRLHRQTCWTPRFFIRGSYARNPDEDDARLRRRLREFARGKVRDHTYRLDDARVRELDRIYRAGLRRVNGGG